MPIVDNMKKSIRNLTEPLSALAPDVNVSTFTLQGPQERLVANIKEDAKCKAERQSLRTPLTDSELKEVNENLVENVSTVFHGSDLTVNELITNINTSAKEKVGDGFGKFKFGFGVANMLTMIYMFGAHPEHFWILYIIESLYFFPFRMYIDWKTKPLRTIFYEFEYCWIVNFVMFFLFVLLAFAKRFSFHSGVNDAICMMLFGTACGPLLAATMVLPLPLLFHSVDIMSSIFIHFFPPALMYIHRWRNEDLVEAWDFLLDIRFNLQMKSFWPIHSFSDATLSLFNIMMCQYFTWFVLYCIWQITIGIDMPRKHRQRSNAPAVYDTSFHANMRDGMCMAYGTYIWKRPGAESQRMIDENDFELKDFAIYMILHFIGVLMSLICLAWPCMYSQTFHAVLLLVAMLIVIIKGAIFYNNIITEVYADIVRESVETEIRKVVRERANDVEGARTKGDPIARHDAVQLELEDIDEDIEQDTVDVVQEFGKAVKDCEEDEQKELIEKVDH